MRKRFFINSPQPFHRRIRIGGRLKVGKKMIALPIPHPHPRDALIDLAKNTRPGQPSARTKTSVITECAAACRNRTVHIGACKSGVDADFLHPSAKTLPEKEIARVVRQSGIAPGQPSFACRKSFG
jgi:hypothetical protein